MKIIKIIINILESKTKSNFYKKKINITHVIENKYKLNYELIKIK